MNSISNLPTPNISNLEQQDDLAVITQKLNQYLAPQKIRAKSAWHNAYLAILLEANTVPNQKEVVALIREIFSELVSESVKTIAIYGRKIGQVTPTWCEEIEVAKSPPSDFSNISLAHWLSQGLETEYSAIVSSQKVTDDDSSKFLYFGLSSQDTALLPLNSIQEILKISPTGVLSVPHMAECIAGIYNYRGEMLWLVDLSLQLGFAASTESLSSLPYSLQSNSWNSTNLTTEVSTLTVIVIHNDQEKLGLIVPQVIDIMIHQNAEISSSSIELFSSNILAFLSGYLTSSNSPILDVNALIRDFSFNLHNYS